MRACDFVLLELLAFVAPRNTTVLFYSLAYFGVEIDAQPLQLAAGIATLYGDLNLFCSIQPFTLQWHITFVQCPL